MTTKLVLIEDEAAAAEHAKKVLTALDFDCDVVAHLTSVEQAVHWFQANPLPDLILMDIQLSDGVSFEILDQVSIECPIIYITAYDQYAIQAFKTTGIDYLLKPLTAEALQESLNSYEKKRAQTELHWSAKHIEVAQAAVNNSADYLDRLLVKNGTALLPIKMEEVAYFVRDQYVYVCTNDGKRFIYDQSLDQLQRRLNPELFVRLSRTLMVNINAVEKLEPYKPGKLAVSLSPSLGEAVQLSQERSSWLRKKLSGEL